MIFLMLTAILLAAYGALIFFYYTHWKRLDLFQKPASPAGIFVSVVVAARNEEHNIGLLLADFAAQEYPEENFEVIVVNDFSTDGTASVVQEQFPHVGLMMPACDPEFSSKKKAIETGVKAAKGELVIITDADCRVPVNWIGIIAAFQQQRQASFIAAPVKYQHNNSILHKFQALDFLILQGITAASVSSGFHNMCNGANLAYTKQAFEKVNGFENIDNVATGDDMLLMHKIWKLDNSRIFYLKSENAIVSTEPMHSWRDLFMQRKRWASKTLLYEDKKIIAVLGFVYLLNLWLPVLMVASIFQAWLLWLALVFLLIKFLVEMPFVSSVARFYREEKLIPFLFLFQPLHIFYTLSVGLLSQFGKYEWKGRRTR